MPTKILDIDVSGKSNDELRNIIETLGLNNLSKESMKKLNDFPKEMKKAWIENPDVTGEFTDDSVKELSKNLIKTETANSRKKAKTNKKADYENKESKSDINNADINDVRTIDENKIYSPAYADVIRKLDKEAYDAACGSHEAPLDRQISHYDNFFDSMKASELNVSDEELEFISERVSMGNYESDRNKFIASEIQKAGGKFTVTQPDYITFNIGSKLKADNIECVVGDELGLPDSKGSNIFITPTKYESGKNPSFDVYYTKDLASAPTEIKNAILEEIREIGYPVDDFEIGESYPANDYEINAIKENVKNLKSNRTVISTLSHDMIQTLEQAQSVLNNGYDEDGYNEDGYDENGHSKDGDYNPMYDKAYTDQGPDF